MKKSLTRLFLLFMVFTFIFSAFGCDNEEQSDKLPIGDSYAEVKAQWENLDRVFIASEYSHFRDYFDVRKKSTEYKHIILNLMTKVFDLENANMHSYAFYRDASSNKEIIVFNGRLYIEELNSLNKKLELQEIPRPSSSGYTFTFSFISYGYQMLNEKSYVPFKPENAADEAGNYTKGIHVYSDNCLIADLYYTCKVDCLTTNYFISLLKQCAVEIGGENPNGQEEVRTISNSKRLVSEAITFNTYEKLRIYEKENPQLFNNYLPVLVCSSAGYSFIKSSELNYLKEGGSVNIAYSQGGYMESLEIINRWFEFSFYSYFTPNNNISFTYEYCMLEDEKYNRAILVYQGENLVGEFYYVERLPRGYKVILNYLSENLQFLGGNDI